MRILLTYLVCASMYHFLVDALRCNLCFYDTFLNGTACSTTIKNCTSIDKFCATIWQERGDGTKTFTRDCVPDEVCKQEYCENLSQGLRLKSCSVTQCCQEDLCNRDGYNVKSNHASHLCWSLGYPCFIAIAQLISLFWECLC